MPSRVLQWLSLVGIIWLQSINGTNFNFPSYSSQLKQQLSISQLHLNNLAFASDAGKLFGWFSGLAANYLPLWLVLMIGSFLGLLGYGLQYLFITNQLHSPSYCLIFLLTVVAGNSICWINTVCYTVAIRNFPSNRQLAVGISTSYQGLSAKIYTDIVNSIFPKRPSKGAKTLVLLSSVLQLGVSVLASPFAKVVQLVEEKENLGVGFVVIIVITIATGIFAVVTSVVAIPAWSGLAGILVPLFLQILVSVVEKVKESVKERHRMVRDENGTEDVERIEKKLESGGGGDGRSAMEEIGTKQMLKEINFWLYFVVYLLGPSIGLVFLNNLGKIAQSRQINNVSSLVSLSSSAGFLGRLLSSFTGFLDRPLSLLLNYLFPRSNSSKYLKWRPGWMMALMALMCVGFFILFFVSNNGSLYVNTAIISFCTGAIITISLPPQPPTYLEPTVSL